MPRRQPPARPSAAAGPNGTPLPPPTSTPAVLPLSPSMDNFLSNATTCLNGQLVPPGRLTSSAGRSLSGMECLDLAWLLEGGAEAAAAAGAPAGEARCDGGSAIRGSWGGLCACVWAAPCVYAKAQAVLSAASARPAALPPAAAAAPTRLPACLPAAAGPAGCDAGGCAVAADPRLDPCMAGSTAPGLHVSTSAEAGLPPLPPPRHRRRGSQAGPAAGEGGAAALAPHTPMGSSSAMDPHAAAAAAAQMEAQYQYRALCMLYSGAAGAAGAGEPGPPASAFGAGGGSPQDLQQQQQLAAYQQQVGRGWGGGWGHGLAQRAHGAL